MYRSVAFLAALALSCASAAPGQAPDVAVLAPPPDSALAPALTRTATRARDAIAGWAGAPMPHPFAIRVYPSREGFPAPECRSVAVADTGGIALLSPRLWAGERCGRDGSDSAAVGRVIRRAVVHVYHSQVNPAWRSLDPTDLGWFVEGVAVFASGELSGAGMAQVRRRLESGYPIATLREVLAGPLGSDGAGSVIAYVDHQWGRATLVHLLRATSLAQLLGMLGQGEQELLGGWQAWMLE